jgi:ribonuclease HII
MENKQKTASLYEYDAEKRLQYPLLCGVDEAGRGPLAGDVYAAAVILHPERLPVGLNDSKKLTEKKREQLFPQIQEMALAYCVATASVAEIEQYNILGATMLAMQRAVAGLTRQPDYVLIDGNRLPELSVPAETVVKGDATSACIAAASILAKVSRDHKLLELDAQYPQYGFAKHKGYGTKAHREAILQYGACPVHRPSFLRKILQHETDGK